VSISTILCIERSRIAHNTSLPNVSTATSTDIAQRNAKASQYAENVEAPAKKPTPAPPLRQNAATAKKPMRSLEQRLLSQNRGKTRTRAAQKSFRFTLLNTNSNRRHVGNFNGFV